MLVIIFKIVFVLVYLLLSLAFFTLAERKIMAATQRRKGPNVIGIYGLLQPLADGLKLLLKEGISPSYSNKTIFIFAPILTFFISLISWVVIPFSDTACLAEINLALLYILAASSIGVYGILIAGWSSNSKYSFLGAMRSAAQMVSYELSIGFAICTVVLCVGSFSLVDIVNYQVDHVWFVFPLFPIFLLFLLCMVAETNRHPFDLPEAEAELVSGYNTEYSGMKFALFSLGEYSSIFIMSSLAVCLFFGGWDAPFYLYIIPGPFWFGLKINIFVILFVLFRAALPRFRYDQLMDLGWKFLFPAALFYFFFMYWGLWILNSFPI